MLGGCAPAPRRTAASPHLHRPPLGVQGYPSHAGQREEEVPCVAGAPGVRGAPAYLAALLLAPRETGVASGQSSRVARRYRWPPLQENDVRARIAPCRLLHQRGPTGREVHFAAVWVEVVGRVGAGRRGRGPTECVPVSQGLTLCTPLQLGWVQQRRRPPERARGRGVSALVPPRVAPTPPPPPCSQPGTPWEEGGHAPKPRRRRGC